MVYLLKNFRGNIGRRPRTHGEVVASFWSRVEVGGEDECWLWKGPKNDEGYGHIKVSNRNIKAHRFSNELFFGPIPDRIKVCHTCDNPPCCNPKHHFRGTDLDNMRDKIAKGRQRHEFGMQRKNAKLTDQMVIEIRETFTGKRGQVNGFARRFGVSKFPILSVIHGTGWKHVK